MKKFKEIFEYLRIFSKNTDRYEKINIILIRYQKTVKNERISLGPRKQNVFFGRQSSSDQEIYIISENLKEIYEYLRIFSKNSNRYEKINNKL